VADVPLGSWTWSVSAMMIILDEKGKTFKSNVGVGGLLHGTCVGWVMGKGLPSQTRVCVCVSALDLNIMTLVVVSYVGGQRQCHETASW
jgi:hypothetical protein